MVYLLDGVPVDHWDVDQDGLVVGIAGDGRVAQCELWSIRTVGFDYTRLPDDAKSELMRLTESYGTADKPPARQG